MAYCKVFLRLDWEIENRNDNEEIDYVKRLLYV